MFHFTILLKLWIIFITMVYSSDELSDDEDDRSEVEYVYDFAEPNDDDSIQPSTSNHAKASTNTGKGKRQLGCSTKIQGLSAEQSELLRGLFKTNVHLQRELKREECEKLKKKYPILDTLPWKKIKNTVHNWITIEKRKHGISFGISRYR
ncbi:hypothetical protein MAR_018519 [Mya arenaria]|uniref:Uncharacterized protein n=1 Tax=Mya arenaria TaxID=6604 RepID=A0ABY7EMZ7_MYAAR|nr:hypothetical protein MAR_018519 [Mya arenaria]